MSFRRSLTLSPRNFRWLALATFVSTLVIMVTGAAVRLTGSGLGCPDWPTCYHGRLSGSWSVHPLIEYTNRMVTGAIVILVVATIIGAWHRRPYRRDLLATALGLLLGVIADAVLGMFVVYSKLNPWLVCLHLVVSLAMVVTGAVLYHRSKYRYGDDAPALVRNPRTLLIARGMWLPYLATVVAGTITSGCGPHAGSSQGQLHARRLPFSLQSVAWIHSFFATVMVSLIAGLFVLLWKSDAPERLQRGVRRLLIIGALQGVLGFTQYWSRLPVLLVGLHVALAASLAIGVTQFHLSQTAREREPGVDRDAH